MGDADPVVLHFGGNGHAAVRLDRAREALRKLGGPTLVDVPYPGFERRPPADSFDVFLAATGDFCRRVEPPPRAALASGIGALIALGLRARGDLQGVPLIFQGPVLWGLESRIFPRLMRPRLARRLLQWSFTRPFMQRRFVRRQFRQPVDWETRARFFAGYSEAASFGDLFGWITPAWLRTLERRFRDDPGALGGVTIWLGGRDHVVGEAEVRATELALGVRWPVVEHPDWGHYPALDEPGEWASALIDAVGSAPTVR